MSSIPVSTEPSVRLAGCISTTQRQSRLKQGGGRKKQEITLENGGRERRKKQKHRKTNTGKQFPSPRFCRVRLSRLRLTLLPIGLWLHGDIHLFIPAPTYVADSHLTAHHTVLHYCRDKQIRKTPHIRKTHGRILLPPHTSFQLPVSRFWVSRVGQGGPHRALLPPTSTPNTCPTSSSRAV